jgi:lipopolysaccharide/colanic/teichoic acid biosynthesis glycosyltransferase
MNGIFSIDPDILAIGASGEKGGNSDLYFFTKRMIDITISLFALIFFLPIMLALSGVIHLHSRGPVIEVQKRIGTIRRKMHGQICWERIEFYLFSFRKLPRLEKFLFRTRLGSLPTLWNVLRGEMSLIGPKPVTSEQIKALKPDQYRRFEAKPGLMGLSQLLAKGLPNFDYWLGLDIEYVRCRSFKVDIEILFLSIFAL